MNAFKWFLILAFFVNLSACSTFPISVGLKNNSIQASPTSDVSSLALARQKIKHIVIIMQENRSFDSYFGTYPGAEGLPQQNGKFAVCVNDPQKGTCVYPFHDAADRNLGGPHTADDAQGDMNGGHMDGFLAQAEKAKADCQ